jgi:ribokinase
MNTQKIFVIGSSNTDMVVGTNKIPRPGETIIGRKFMMNPGGKGANQAVAVSRLGGNVTFVARIGDDVFGDESMDNYRKADIDTKYIFRDKNHPSGVALICVDDNAENSIVVSPGANNELSIHDIETVKKDLESANYLLLQLEIPIETVEYAACIAAKANVKVILNPAPAIQLPKKLLKNIYLITPNETEAELLTGVIINNLEDVKLAAKKLIDMGVKNVIITLGASGSLFGNADGFSVQGARKVEAVDTTAAGDVFNGALCVAFAEGKDIWNAVHFATVAASISVTRTGAQSSIPMRKEVDAILLKQVQQ